MFMLLLLSASSNSNPDRSPWCHRRKSKGINSFSTYNNNYLGSISTFAITSVIYSENLNEQNFYVAYLGDQPVDKDLAVQTHIQILASVKGGRWFRDSDHPSSLYLHRWWSSFWFLTTWGLHTLINQLSWCQGVDSL